MSERQNHWSGDLITFTSVGGKNVEPTGQLVLVFGFRNTAVLAGDAGNIRDGAGNNVFLTQALGADEHIEIDFPHPLIIDGLSTAISNGNGNWAVIYRRL